MSNPMKAAFACASLLVSALGWAAGQTSVNYAIPRDAINAGVADTSSTNYRLSASVGDAVATGTITSASYQLASGFRGQINITPALLNLLTVVSRKLHGAIPTPFEIVIDQLLPITGSITVEPRTGGTAGHMLVFHFDGAVSAVGAATALDALSSAVGNISAPAFSGNDVTVTLTNVPDNKRLTVTLTGVNGSATPVTASMGFLVGDVNNTRSVTAADISGVKARSGQTTTSLNFKFDVNATGAVSASDISAVKARSGLTLP